MVEYDGEEGEARDEDELGLKCRGPVERLKEARREALLPVLLVAWESDDPRESWLPPSRLLSLPFCCFCVSDPFVWSADGSTER